MRDPDDVFNEASSELDVGRKHWDQTDRRLNQVGYREGFSTGQDTTLQQGFDDGYKKAVVESHEWAQLQGNICALLLYNQLTAPSHILNDTVIHQLYQLLDEIIIANQNVSNFLKKKAGPCKVVYACLGLRPSFSSQSPSETEGTFADDQPTQDATLELAAPKDKDIESDEATLLTSLKSRFNQILTDFDAGAFSPVLHIGLHTSP